MKGLITIHDWLMDLYTLCLCQSSWKLYVSLKHTHSDRVLTDEAAETTRNGEGSTIFHVGARLGAVIPMMRR